MAMRNPYSNYKQNAVFTATKEELTLMLYDGAIKFCNQAIVAIEHKDVPKAHELIQKVSDIIMEFQITLDDKYDVSLGLGAIYEYLLKRLTTANVKKDAAIVGEVRDYIRQLRDTWKEAMQIAKSAK